MLSELAACCRSAVFKLIQNYADILRSNQILRNCWWRGSADCSTVYTMNQNNYNQLGGGCGSRDWVVGRGGEGRGLSNSDLSPALKGIIQSDPTTSTLHCTALHCLCLCISIKQRKKFLEVQSVWTVENIIMSFVTKIYSTARWRESALLIIQLELIRIADITCVNYHVDSAWASD